MFDLIISVNGRPFPTAKSLLAAKSDYFKSLMETVGLGEPVGPGGVSHFALPAIIPTDIFAILISGVHSPGSMMCLLNDNNVYQVFLYAQLLQMAEAVEHCRIYLKRTTSSASAGAQTLKTESGGPLVVRPIPRQPLPSGLGPPQLPPHVQEVFREQQQASPWYPLWPYSPFANLPYRGELALPTTSNLARPTAVRLQDQSHKENLKRKAESSHTNNSQDEDTLIIVEDEDEELEVDSERIVDLAGDLKKLTGKVSVSIPAKTEKVFDVTACDGPVRFHRVPNPAAKPNDEDEDQSQDKSGNGKSKEKIYECLYCSHTFKSHYCYQKHKRRHINPFALEFSEDSEQPESKPKPEVIESERKLRVLKDVNVQFFPCKICGAKFPSYYFVHKHKKMWHKEELEEEERKERAKMEERKKEKEASAVATTTASQ